MSRVSLIVEERGTAYRLTLVGHRGGSTSQYVDHAEPGWVFEVEGVSGHRSYDHRSTTRFPTAGEAMEAGLAYLRQATHKAEQVEPVD